MDWMDNIAHDCPVYEGSEAGVNAGRPHCEVFSMPGYSYEGRPIRVRHC